MDETFEDLLDALIGDAFRLGQQDRWYAMPELHDQRQAILDYVKRLEARQITPEMQAIWDDYDARVKRGEMMTTTALIEEQSNRELKLWRAFCNMMRQHTPDAP